MLYIRRYKGQNNFLFSAPYWQIFEIDPNATYNALCGYAAPMCVQNFKSKSSIATEIFEVKEKHVLAARGATYLSKSSKIAQQRVLISVKLCYKFQLERSISHRDIRLQN